MKLEFGVKPRYEADKTPHAIPKDEDPKSNPKSNPTNDSGSDKKSTNPNNKLDNYNKTNKSKLTSEDGRRGHIIPDPRNPDSETKRTHKSNNRNSDRSKTSSRNNNNKNATTTNATTKENNKKNMQSNQRKTTSYGGYSTAPKNFFVFDIETVPCIETARKLLSISQETTDEEVVQKLTDYHLEATNGQNSFHRQLFHKIVCVSFVSGKITTNEGKEEYELQHIKTGGRGDESEEQIIRKLFDYLQKNPSRLISYNGRTFDLPVLQYRAMKYGIQANWIYSGGMYNYNHRYSADKHLDLIDSFSNFGASARVKMSEVASLVDIPCKISTDGSEVSKLYNENKIEEICNYCETDAFCTYALYLRFLHHSGKITTEIYNKSIDNLLTKLKDSDAPEHWKEYAESWSTLTKGEFHLSS